MITKISTADMSRDEWVASRKGTIGGSDAATIIGLNQWSSPYALWAEKTGRVPEQEDNEKMRQGRDLEEYVAQRFCEETGKKVRRCNYTMCNSDYPWAHANIDRAIIGEDAGLECKTTTSLRLSSFKNGEYPLNYYVQSMHYLAVTGKARWYIAVLILGVGFKWFCVERDEDEIAELMRAEYEFSKYLEDDTPPPIDGSEATTKSINDCYGTDIASTDEVTPLDECEEGLERIIALEREISALTNIVNEEKNKIKAKLGHTVEGESIRFRATWKPQTRKTFDAARFAADHPELDLSNYYKQSTYRVFNLKQKEIETNG